MSVVSGEGVCERAVEGVLPVDCEEEEGIGVGVGVAVLDGFGVFMREVEGVW